MFQVICKVDMGIGKIDTVFFVLMEFTVWEERMDGTGCYENL